MKGEIVTMNDLPRGFEDLAPFLDWNLPTAHARQAKRRQSSREELRSFYDAVLPKMPAILAEIDHYPLGELPENHQPLFNLALSLAEVAPNVELYKGNPAVPYAFEETRLVAIHGGQQTWRGLSPMAEA